MYLGRYPLADEPIPPPRGYFGVGWGFNLECRKLLLKNLNQTLAVMVLDEVSVRALPISFVVCV
jgi:hypothetical protein